MYTGCDIFQWPKGFAVSSISPPVSEHAAASPRTPSRYPARETPRPVTCLKHCTRNSLRPRECIVSSALNKVNAGLRRSRDKWFAVARKNGEPFRFAEHPTPQTGEGERERVVR